MKRLKLWFLVGLIVVLAAFLVPWGAAADKIGVLVNGTFTLDIGTLLSGSGVTGSKVTVTSHAATETATAATLYGNTHLVTGAFTVTLPTAVSGYNATFCSTTAAVFSIDLQATDYWILNGTTLTQANKVSSSGFAGECITFVSTAANYYRSEHTNGTFIDGGA